jgi:hypothetical protein
MGNSGKLSYGNYLMMGFIELGNPAGRSLIPSRRSHLRGNTPNMHRIKKTQLFTCEEKGHLL